MTEFTNRLPEVSITALHERMLSFYRVICEGLWREDEFSNNGITIRLIHLRYCILSTHQYQRTFGSPYVVVMSSAKLQVFGLR